MKSHESGVKNNSTIYFYTASTQAKRTFYYPICLGYFYYEANYHLKRDAYDSFLLMYVTNGECTIKLNSDTYCVVSGQIALIDCYKPHEYYSDKGWEALWIHFDGVTAREYYNYITSTNAGNIITLKDNYLFHKSLRRIYDIFNENSFIKEPVISSYITNMLTELALVSPVKSQDNASSDAIDEVVTYINEHICDNLSLKHLASIASLSPYYFLRLFKKEVGMPPHEYIIETRINAAKFYLKTTSLSVKEIAGNLGFTSESSFCTTFKNRVNVTPSMYRTASFTA